MAPMLHAPCRQAPHMPPKPLVLALPAQPPVSPVPPAHPPPHPPLPQRTRQLSDPLPAPRPQPPGRPRPQQPWSSWPWLVRNRHRPRARPHARKPPLMSHAQSPHRRRRWRPHHAAACPPRLHSPVLPPALAAAAAAAARLSRPSSTHTPVGRPAHGSRPSRAQLHRPAAAPVCRASSLRQGPPARLRPPRLRRARRRCATAPALRAPVAGGPARTGAPHPQRGTLRPPRALALRCLRMGVPALHRRHRQQLRCRRQRRLRHWLQRRRASATAGPHGSRVRAPTAQTPRAPRCGAARMAAALRPRALPRRRSAARHG
eukprot:109374-Chlamydomonas_euryale.AAC.1